MRQLDADEDYARRLQEEEARGPKRQSSGSLAAAAAIARANAASATGMGSSSVTAISVDDQDTSHASSSGGAAASTAGGANKTPTIKKALVVGIGAYPSHPLRCARNDADDVHAALVRMGFHATKVLDCSSAGFAQATEAFCASLNPGDEALFYFAGHGVEAATRQAGHMNSSNWLLSTQIPPTNAELPRKAVDAHNLLAEMEARDTRFNVMILDCCRDNPLPDGTRGVGGGGLGEMHPKGSYIAFACAPRSVAAEGPNGRNGIFTEHLLKHVETKKQRVEDLFIEVRNGVEQATSDASKFTRGKQIPYCNSTLRVKNATLAD